MSCGFKFSSYEDNGLFFLFSFTLKARSCHGGDSVVAGGTGVVVFALGWAPTDNVVGHCVRPAVCPSVRPERRSHSKSWWISAISLKIGEMMHGTMEPEISWGDAQ